MNASAPRWYTPRRIAVGRENVGRHAWAKDVHRRILDGDPGDYFVGREYASARAIASLPDEAVWTLMPTTRLPRVYPQETHALCPVHGMEVRKVHAWTAWRTDPIGHPYKVQCRLGGEWYPSNDWLAGDMESGPFPDDGDGCLHEGKRYYFLREYAHLVYGNQVIPGLSSLSQAWLLTGEAAYGRAGCILLSRLASEYPNFTDRRDRLFYARFGGRDPHYEWKRGGMVSDLIWEGGFLEATAYAYDGLRGSFTGDPGLIRFLASRGLPVAGAEDACRYIEENLLRVGMQGLCNGHIKGNEGHHQAAATACALVMDDWSGRAHPDSRDMLEYAYHGFGHCAHIMDNGLTRDGSGHESPGYNTIKLDFIRVERVMEEMRAAHPDLVPEGRYPDLFAGPKGRALFDHNIDIVMQDAQEPSVGDCRGIEAPRRSPPSLYSMAGRRGLYAFSRWGDPRFARACTRPDGTLLDGELFEPYPEEKIREALRREESRIVRGPRLLDGYGLAILEGGEPGSGCAAALNYSSLLNHRQQDNLNLELFARGLDCLPDLGYPFTWDHLKPWDHSIMAHNTVSVDEAQAVTGRGGAALLFASAGGVQAVTARHDPYPGSDVDLYERTVVLVDAGGGRFYVVDLFVVAGGSQHDQSWHGPLAPVIPPALGWVAQRGTLAGPDVQRFASYTDRWGRTGVNFPCYLSQIRRAGLDRPACWSWDYGLPEGDRLALHVVPVGGPLEAILGTGSSPARPADWGLDFLILRRAAPGPSRFLTVLDAYQGTPTVRGVRLVSESPLELDVARDGAVDRIGLAAPPGPGRTTAHRPHGVRVRTRAGGSVLRDLAIGSAPEGPGWSSGVIRDVRYGEDVILVEPAGDPDGLRPGRALRVFNADRTAMFRIREASREGALFRLRLDMTALFARGPVVGTGDGALKLGAWLTFADGTMRDGRVDTPGGNAFAGCRIGEGAASRIVEAALRGDPSLVLLRDRIPAADLTREYGGRTVSLWQYGPGDLVEAARVTIG